jgi:hypothetical protein
MLEEVLHITEASNRYDVDVDKLERRFKNGRVFKYGVDCHKVEGVWLVTRLAMEREYGLSLTKTIKEMRESFMECNAKIDHSTFMTPPTNERNG